MNILDAFECALDGKRIARESWFANNEPYHYFVLVDGEGGKDGSLVHKDGYWELIWTITLDWVMAVDWIVVE